MVMWTEDKVFVARIAVMMLTMLLLLVLTRVSSTRW